VRATVAAESDAASGPNAIEPTSWYCSATAANSRVCAGTVRPATAPLSHRGWHVYIGIT